VVSVDLVVWIVVGAVAASDAAVIKTAPIEEDLEEEEGETEVAVVDLIVEAVVDSIVEVVVVIVVDVAPSDLRVAPHEALLQPASTAFSTDSLSN